jgi:hypothetical protein
MKIARYIISITFLVSSIIISSSLGYAATVQIPAAAPMTTDLAGGSGATTFSSVLRVVCPAKQSSGTGFLDKSGKVITVFHVISGYAAQDIFYLASRERQLK